MLKLYLVCFSLIPCESHCYCYWGKTYSVSQLVLGTVHLFLIIYTIV